MNQREDGQERPLRVLRVITRLNIGGPTVHVNLLTRGLRERGFETTLVAGACSAEDGVAGPGSDVAGSTVRIPEMSKELAPIRDGVALFKLIRLMRAQRPDIVHTHLSKAGVLGRIAALVTGVPVVVHTFHGNTLSAYFSRSANEIFRMVEKALAWGSTCICVVSEQQQREMTERFRIGPREKVRVIPLGLDLWRYSAIEPLTGAPRNLTVGWVGRMVPIKNVPLLTDIIRTCRARNLKMRFLIAGGGPGEPQILKLMSEIPAGNVAYLGWQTDISKVLAQCDVLIQTSRNEGTPLALIEGMAAGRPFVSTAVGGVTDMVSGQAEASGQSQWFENGVLCEPSAAAFCDVLQHLQRDVHRLSAMGRSAREFASLHYSSRRLVTDIADLYWDLAGRSCSGRLILHEHRGPA